MGSLSTLNLQGLPDFGPRARQAAQWAPAAASLLAAAAAGHLLAVLAWSLVPVPEAGRWRAPPAAAPSGPVTAPAQSSLSAGVDLFGHYEPVAVAAAAASTSAAPDTALNLTLLGILADSREHGQSRALIKANDTPEKPFAVGDAIASAATVKAIFSDRVLLMRAGALETLRMHRGEAAGDAGTAGNAEPVSQIPDNETQGQKLTRIRNQVLNSPNDVNTYLHINPVPASAGQPPGFRVFPGMDASLFTPDGLHPGDLITQINGQPLSDPAKALQLVSTLSNAQQVTLSVVRGRTAPQSIVVNFNQ